MNSWVTKSGQKVVQVLSGRSNASLVCSGDAFLLVDCGTKKHWSALKHNLDILGVKPGNLKALVLTHAHYDHAENAGRITKEYGAKVLIHACEEPFLAEGKNSPIKGSLPYTKLLTSLFGAFAENKYRYDPVQIIGRARDGQDLAEFGFGARILHTPGHTSGSVSVIVDNELGLAGDAMFGIYRGSVYPPYALSPRDMVASWGKLLRTGCSVFLPGHGTPNSRELLVKQHIKYEKRFLKPPHKR